MPRQYKRNNESLLSIILLVFINIITRVNFFAAHCYGRIQSYKPMSSFLVANFLTMNWFKEILSAWGLERIPAWLTLGYYFVKLTSKAKETYDNHPDSRDPEESVVIRCNKARTILFQLQLNPVDTRGYLEEAKFSKDQINELVVKDASEIKNISETLLVDLFPLFRAMYAYEHPHTPSRSFSLQSGLSHFVPHPNEAVLAMVFSGINIFSDKEITAEKVVFSMLLLLGLVCSVQAYLYTSRPKMASSKEIMCWLAEHAGLLRTHSSKQVTEITDERTSRMEVAIHEFNETTPLFKWKQIEPTLAEKVRREDLIDADMACCQP